MAATTMKPTERQLRVIQLLCWAPGFALPLAASIESGQPYYACILIPITLSAFHGIALLTNRVRPHGIIDLAFAVVIMGMLIPYWIVMAESLRYWRFDIGDATLTSFGSAPPTMTFAIHAWLALPTIAAILSGSYTSLAGLTGCSHCPHCQRESRNNAARIDPRLLWDLTPNGSNGGSSVHSHDTKKGYVSVSADDAVEAETTPRASIDDETARLV